MGNRAVIAFTDNSTTKPRVCVYMHWNGGPESFYAILDVMREARGLVHSAAYSTARFSHLACALVGHDGHSVGIERFGSIDSAAGMGEDNGLYLVDVNAGSVQRYKLKSYDAARPAKFSDDEVADEERRARAHKYWENDGIRAKLRACVVEEKCAA